MTDYSGMGWFQKDLPVSPVQESSTKSIQKLQTPLMRLPWVSLHSDIQQSASWELLSVPLFFQSTSVNRAVSAEAVCESVLSWASKQTFFLFIMTLKQPLLLKCHVHVCISDVWYFLSVFLYSTFHPPLPATLEYATQSNLMKHTP
jgi:hypothetical protein